MNPTNLKDKWKADHFGSGFEMRYVTQPDDYSGQVRCTVIRKQTSQKGNSLCTRLQ